MSYNFDYTGNDILLSSKIRGLGKMGGKRLKSLRRQFQLSQEDVADFLGYSQVFISLVEGQKRRLNLGDQVALKQFFEYKKKESLLS